MQAESITSFILKLSKVERANYWLYIFPSTQSKSCDIFECTVGHPYSQLKTNENQGNN